MAPVTKNIKLNITADVNQAVQQLRSLGEVQTSSGGTAFDSEAFNTNVRNAVGSLGDVDTALQTLGSTLGIVELQIVGDAFAIGEAMGQLVGVAPQLFQQFGQLANALGTSTMALGAFGVAMAGIGVAFALATSSARQASEALTQQAQADVAGLEARIQAENMSAEQRAKIAEDSATRIAGLEDIIAEKRATNEAIYQANVENSGKLAADVAKLTGSMTEVSDEYITSLESQLQAEKERLSVYQDVGTETTKIADDFEMVTPAIQSASKATEGFTEALAKVEETTKGASSGMVLSSQTALNGIIKNNEETEELMKEADRKREDALQSQIDFLNRQAQIEDEFRRGRSEAIRNFDVASFLGAEGRRNESLAQLGAPSITVNAQVGELVTPSQLNEQVGAITTGITQALIELPGV